MFRWSDLRPFGLMGDCGDDRARVLRLEDDYVAPPFQDYVHGLGQRLFALKKHKDVSTGIPRFGITHPNREKRRTLFLFLSPRFPDTLMPLLCLLFGDAFASSWVS